MKLTKDFYIRTDVVRIAHELIGKVLITQMDGIYTSGIILETEAYNGVFDKACHAYNGRRTARNEVMYSEGGNAYIYLCYGIHHLFNVVTNNSGLPDAVLIRAIYPLDGLRDILIRRNRKLIDKTVAGGPGTVSQALGLHTGLSGKTLYKTPYWIEDRKIKIDSAAIKITKRIGVESAGKDALLPYRFVADFNYFHKHDNIDKFRRDKKR